MGVHTLRENKNGAKRAEGMLLEGISGAPKERRDKGGNARNVPEHPVSTQRPLGPLFPESGPPACPATRHECCSAASPLVRGKYGKKGTIEGEKYGNTVQHRGASVGNCRRGMPWAIDAQSRSQRRSPAAVAVSKPVPRVTLSQGPRGYI